MIIKLQTVTMNIIFVGFVLSIILLGLLIAKKTKHYYNNTINSVIIQMYVYGIMVNICILGYILIVFKNTEPMSGPQGPTGEIGPKGFTGDPSECNSCDRFTENIGFKQNSEKKKTEIFTEMPTLTSNLVGKPL